MIYVLTQYWLEPYVFNIYAENSKPVRDFALELGLMAWNALELNPLTPMSYFMDNMYQAPPTIY
jgi:hypothetical protein